jgi:hypothetical protein
MAPYEPQVKTPSGAIVKTCGWVVSSGLLITSVLILFGSFDEFAVDEERASTDEGDQVGCVDHPPPGLG